MTSAPKALKSTPALESGIMLAAPPCNVEGEATLLAPNALTATPPAVLVVPVAVTGAAVLVS